MNKYTNYKPEFHNEVWYVTGEIENQPDTRIRIAKVPHWIRHQKAVATAVADSLNRNKKLQLVDLI